MSLPPESEDTQERTPEEYNAQRRKALFWMAVMCAVAFLMYASFIAKVAIFGN